MYVLWCCWLVTGKVHHYTFEGKKKQRERRGEGGGLGMKRQRVGQQDRAVVSFLQTGGGKLGWSCLLRLSRLHEPHPACWGLCSTGNMQIFQLEGNGLLYGLCLSQGKTDVLTTHRLAREVLVWQRGDWSWDPSSIRLLLTAEPSSQPGPTWGMPTHIGRRWSRQSHLESAAAAGKPGRARLPS